MDGLQLLKRSQYAYQQEYRFVITTHGDPATQALLFPVSGVLRALTGMWGL